MNDEEALASYARDIDCNILITGHTHELKLKDHDGVLLVNPGSATGAYSTYNK